MIARLSSIPPIHISLAALVSGFLLIISGYVPFAILGAGLILFSFLLPFLRLGIKPNPPIAPAARPVEAVQDAASAPTAVAPGAADTTTVAIAFPNPDEAMQALAAIYRVPLERRDITVDNLEASSETGGGVRVVLTGTRDGMTKEQIEERYRQIRESSQGHGRDLPGRRREEPGWETDDPKRPLAGRVEQPR